MVNRPLSIIVAALMGMISISANTALAREADPIIRKAVDYEAIIHDVQGWVERSWAVGNDVWSGAGLENRPLILLFENRAFELSIHGPREVDRTAIDALLPPYPGWPYAFVNFEGRRVTVMDIDTALASLEAGDVDAFPPPINGARFIFDYAGHESFHDVQNQQGWNPPIPFASAIPYPIDGSWPLWRSLTYHELWKAVSDPGARQKHIANAAFWHRQWAQRFGSVDWIRTSDILEGTAQFVDLQLRAAADAIDPADREERLSRIPNYTYRWEPRLQSNFLFTKNDSYMIGALAGTALDMTTDADWRRQVKDHDTIMDVLVSLVDLPFPSPEPDQEIVATNNALITELNRNVGQVILPSIETYLNESSVYLQLPGVVYLPPDNTQAEAVEQARRETVPGTNALFSMEALDRPVQGSWVGAYLVGGGSIFLRNRTLIGGAGDATHIIPLRATDYELNGNHLRLRSNNLIGEFGVSIEPGPGRHTTLIPITGR